MKISIKGARCLDPEASTDTVADMAIADGKIVSLGNVDGFTADKTIDASGLICCPGLVDTACRLREPGQTEKGTIASETRAAALSGILHMMCYPDTRPVLDSAALIQQVCQQAAASGHAKVQPIGALTKNLAGQQLADLTAMQAAGAGAVSNVQFPITSALVALQCYQYASNFNVPIIVRPQVEALYAGTCAHEGQVSTRLGLPSSPDCAETIAVAQHLLLVEHTGAQLHFACLSSAKSVEMIAAAKNKGLPVTASVSAHQCHLTEMDVCDFNANAHVLPPLRTERDKAALIQGLKEGTIDCLCSDHQPHEATAKLAPFGETAPGMSTVDTFFSSVMHLVDTGKLPLMTAIKAMTTNPAQCFSLSAGRLAEGEEANFFLADLSERWEVKSECFNSRGKNTAFQGWSLPGVIREVFLKGQPLAR
jgi:dihydroorotase